MFARVLGTAGRIMIAAGVLLLLFVAYQLWGTGYRTDLAQNNLKDKIQHDIDTARAQRASGDAPVATLPGDPTTSTPNGTASPGTTRVPRTTTTRAPGDTTPKGPGDPNDQNLGDAAEFRYSKGEPIGLIDIPSIGSQFAMLEGVDLSLLSEGPGHFPGTAFPGQPGNSAFAGHRVTYKAPFNRIDELVPGDKIVVETRQGKFTYEVVPQADGTGHFITDPSDLSILEDKGQNIITLMACHPKYDLRQRIVVVGKLVGNAADGSVKGASDKLTLPRGDGGDDLSSGVIDSNAVIVGNDPSARLPALLFSLACLAVWFLAYLVGRKWKKWPAYFIAAPFFFVLLWFAFDYINRMLPAAY